MLLASHQLERRLHESEIGIIGNDRLGEGRVLDALLTQFEDLLDDLFDGALAAVQHGGDLHGGSFDDGAHGYSFLGKGIM